jgi:DNA-binding MarR family transcriptional regulator
MAMPSDPDLLVLHGLRLRGFAEAAAVAEAAGLDIDDVAKRLDAFDADGYVRYRRGRVSGWTLTAAGRAHGERLLAEELDAAGARGAVAAAYRRFLERNTEMLGVCTEWQMREVDGRQVVNDHRDPDHDAVVVAHLADLDRHVQPVCAELADLLTRFASYPPRLANALAKVGAGEVDWFTRPTIDSYHTVWFELHENLLATLGIPRAAESA